MSGYMDLRSNEERAMEGRGKQPLEGDDETIAQNLATLVKRTDHEYETDKDAYRQTTEEIYKIGEDLCSTGGDPRMKRVAYRAHALGARIRDIEMFWDGICGWIS